MLLKRKYFYQRTYISRPLGCGDAVSCEACSRPVSSSVCISNFVQKYSVCWVFRIVRAVYVDVVAGSAGSGVVELHTDSRHVHWQLDEHRVCVGGGSSVKEDVTHFMG